MHGISAGIIDPCAAGGHVCPEPCSLGMLWCQPFVSAEDRPCCDTSPCGSIRVGPVGGYFPGKKRKLGILLFCACPNISPAFSPRDLQAASEFSSPVEHLWSVWRGPKAIAIAIQPPQTCSRHSELPVRPVPLHHIAGVCRELIQLASRFSFFFFLFFPFADEIST